MKGREGPHRINGVGEPLAPHLDVAHLKELVAGDGELRHLKALSGRGQNGIALVRRVRRWDEHDPVEIELLANAFDDDEMPDVRRVERAPKDSDFHRRPFRQYTLFARLYFLSNDLKTWYVLLGNPSPPLAPASSSCFNRKRLTSESRT